MFCSTSYSQLESILHFHTQRSLNGSQYKIGGRPRGGRESLNMDNTRQRGGGGSKNSVFGRTSFVNGPLPMRWESITAHGGCCCIREGRFESAPLSSISANRTAFLAAFGF